MYNGQSEDIKHLIVLVDDHIDVSNILAGYFSLAKFNVYKAMSAEECLQKLKELENKVDVEEPQYKEYLQSKDIVNRALPYLYKFGVTDDDIISMANLVAAYLNGNIVFKPNQQSDNIIDENRFVRPEYYWRSFIREIENLGDINSQIVNQSSCLEEIKKEIDNLNSQRQKLNEQTLLSGQLLNSLNSQLCSFMEFIKQTMFFTKDTNITFFIYQPLYLLHVTTKGDSKGDDNININGKSI